MEEAENIDDFTAEEILAQIEQENQLTKMLNHSIADLKVTVDDLDKKYKSVDDESNEWKTRYETQLEINDRLERQLEALKNQMQQKSPKRDAGIKDLEELSGSKLRGLVRQLEKEKQGVHGQLRDLEWRLDQESKALHKALDSRKKFITEMSEAAFNLSSYEKLQKTQDQRKFHASKLPQLKRPSPKSKKVALPPPL